VIFAGLIASMNRALLQFLTLGTSLLGAQSTASHNYRIPTILGDGLTDNTSMLNAALATCKDILLDNGSINGHVVFPPSCSATQTLYIRTSLHVHAPFMLTKSLVGTSNGMNGQGTPVYVDGDIPTCATTPLITASGPLGSATITVSSAAPLKTGSYIGFASINGGPYDITRISGTSITVSPALEAAVPPGTNVVCESPGGLSVNASNLVLRNLDEYGGTVVLNGGGQIVAQIAVQNCSFTLPATSSAVPFVIDGAFELVIDGDAFTPGTGYSMQITNDNLTFIGQIISISHSIFNNRGILINSNNSTELPNDITLSHDIYESLSGDLVDIDSSSGSGFNGLVLDHIVSADSENGRYAVAEVGRSPRGIAGVTINDISQWFGLAVANVNIFGLVILGAGNPGSSAIRFGPQQNYTWLPGDSMDSPGYVHGVGPPSWGIAFSVNQNASTWTASNSGTVALSIAPDGKRTAGLVKCPATLCSVTLFKSLAAVSVGDWIIAGTWAQSESETNSVSQNPLSATVSISGVKIQGPFGGAPIAYPNLLPLKNTLETRVGKQWVPIVNAFKVMDVTSSSATYTFHVSAGKAYPQAFWKPWIVRIPSGALPDEEVIRLARTMF